MKKITSTAATTAATTATNAIKYHLLRNTLLSKGSTTAFFSTHNNNNNTKKKKLHLNSDPPPPSSSSTSSSKQPFVTHKLYPGQPNPLTQIYKKRNIPSDPIYRPPWHTNHNHNNHNNKNQANIISANDYNNRPKVTFDNQFQSLFDGMIVLSWLDEKQRQCIYNDYLIMIQEQYDQKYPSSTTTKSTSTSTSSTNTTSHEYIMKVLGQKYNMSSLRIGAIVQNCHDEEQMYISDDPSIIIENEKISEYVDAKYKEHINNVYNAYGEINPNNHNNNNSYFFEDPIESNDTGGVTSDSSGKDYTSLEDLYDDVDDLIKETIKREKEDAQLEIDGHVYKEDVDDDDVVSEINKECRELIERFNHNHNNDNDNQSTTDTTKRPRWKYVAQAINVRQEKKQHGKKKKNSKNNNNSNSNNTIVEQNGILRPATMKEVNDVAWKNVRNVTEFGFRGVKMAWVDRVKNGNKNGWGRVSEEIKAAARAKLEGEEQSSQTKEGEEKEEQDNNEEKDGMDKKVNNSQEENSSRGNESSKDEEEK